MHASRRGRFVGRRIKAAAAALALVIGAAATGAAQNWEPRFDRWLRWEPRTPTPDTQDGTFHFCRGMYQSGGYGRRGGGWATDYPSADVNFSIRLAELTKTSVGKTPEGEPAHLVVRLTDDALFQCPFILMSEVGSLFFREDEIPRVRQYLEKGGFIWVDDFWGSAAWDSWEENISRVLPPPEYRIVDLPDDHPMFRTMFQKTDGVPQIPSINFWYGSGGGTSERGYDSEEVHQRAILDKAGRLMVLMTHNTDVSDSWEREGEDREYFFSFSVDGYAVAINTLIYVMTH
jgi:hypothetical protein